MVIWFQTIVHVSLAIAGARVVLRLDRWTTRYSDYDTIQSRSIAYILVWISWIVLRMVDILISSSRSIQNRLLPKRPNTCSRSVGVVGHLMESGAYLVSLPSTAFHRSHKGSKMIWYVLWLQWIVDLSLQSTSELDWSLFPKRSPIAITPTLTPMYDQQDWDWKDVERFTWHIYALLPRFRV